MNKIKCLLIDDDDDDHELFAMAIKEVNHSFEYKLSKNGTESLNSLKETTSTAPDYIFLDLNMPQLDGKKCLTQIREIEHLHKAKIVIFTASSNSKDIEEVSVLGASHYLIKPSNFQSLVTSLGSIFEQSDLPFLIEP